MKDKEHRIQILTVSRENQKHVSRSNTAPSLSFNHTSNESLNVGGLATAEAVHTNRKPIQILKIYIRFLRDR